MRQGARERASGRCPVLWQDLARAAFPADGALVGDGLRGPYLVAYLASLWAFAFAFARYVEAPLMEQQARWLANPASQAAIRRIDVAMLVWAALMGAGAAATSAAVWVGVSFDFPSGGGEGAAGGGGGGAGGEQLAGAAAEGAAAWWEGRG